MCNIRKAPTVVIDDHYTLARISTVTIDSDKTAGAAEHGASDKVAPASK
jgi:hypothetical protein